MVKIKELNIPQLFDLLNAYPWYAFARRELFEKMSESSTDYMESYLKKYVPYLFSGRAISLKDLEKKEEQNIISDLISGLQKQDNQPISKTTREHQYMVGGDYFGRDDLKSVQGDNSYLQPRKIFENNYKKINKTENTEFYETETLARIYSEQGFYQRAIDIYKKLILLNPEKNTYFASLIEDLKKKI